MSPRVRPNFTTLSGFSDNCRALTWLQEHCYTRLTKWEQQFTDDLIDRIENGDISHFTPKQQAVIDRMWEAYAVQGR